MQQHGRRALLAILAATMTLALTWAAPEPGFPTGVGSPVGPTAFTVAAPDHGAVIARPAGPTATAGHRAYRQLGHAAGLAGRVRALLPPMVIVVGLLVARGIRPRPQACPGGPLSRGPPVARLTSLTS